jgi:hypothetical protein
LIDRFRREPAADRSLQGSNRSGEEDARWSKAMIQIVRDFMATAAEFLAS